MRRALFLSFVLALAVCARVATLPAAARMVAIGDVHGGFEPFVSILTSAKLIDGQRQWSGGNSILVQTGDVTDRGPGVREALDLLMALEKQAAAAGGKVHVLLGNHEVMNMLGETRDVSAEAFSAFGGDAAYREAFARDGKYGKWLRGKPAILELDGTVFMHAGINLDFSKDSIGDLNRRIRREIDEWDNGVKWLETQRLVKAAAPLTEVARVAREEVEWVAASIKQEQPVTPEARRGALLLLPLTNVGASSLFSGDGPLWFRGFATWSDADGATRMSAVLKHHRVKRFVTGHSVQTGGRITERFAGSLFLIDTGMLNGRFYPAGKPSALEINGEVATPVYATRESR